MFDRFLHLLSSALLLVIGFGALLWDKEELRDISWLPYASVAIIIIGFYVLWGVRSEKPYRRNKKRKKNRKKR